MNLLLISDLDRTGAAFAEKLSETHHVTVFHPNAWSLESNFAEKCMHPRRILTKNLADYAAIFVLLSSGLHAQYLECLLERLNQWPQIPCFCLSPCMAMPRSGMPAFSAEEALCRLYREEYQLQVFFVRVPAVYGEDFLPEDVMKSLLRRPASNRIELNGRAEDAFDLLHVSDLAALAECLLRQAPATAKLEVGSAHAASLGDVSEIIKAHFLLTELHYTPNDMPSTEVCKGNYHGWMPRHSFLQDMPDVLLCIEKFSHHTLMKRRNMHLQQLGRCGLFLLLFACVCLYTNFIKVSSELQFVDVRLLFVVGISLYMGRNYGLAAGIAASVASVVEAIGAGTRWYVIFFHIDNWIPMAVYLATAVLLGMYGDNHRTKETTENES